LVLRTFFRMAWVVTALVVAIAVALTVLFALGAVWVGDELKEAAPNDPLLREVSRSRWCRCSLHRKAPI
jgi:hypothetical protein